MCTPVFHKEVLQRFENNPSTPNSCMYYGRISYQEQMLHPYHMQKEQALEPDVIHLFLKHCA